MGSVGSDAAYPKQHQDRYPRPAFFCKDLVMKIFLRTFFLYWFKKSICQLNGKRMLSTGKLPLGVPRNGVVMKTDCSDMTSAVYRGRKTTNQSNKQTI